MWDTQQRLSFSVRQHRFVQELDGGVVVPQSRGHLEKIFENSVASLDRSAARISPGLPTMFETVW